MTIREAPPLHTRDRQRWFSTLGEAVTILLNSDRCSVGIASVGAFVLPFIKLDQLRIFRGNNDFPAAYLTWGFLTDEALRRRADDPAAVPDIDELNAGDKLVVFDMVSHLRDFRPVVAEMRRLASGRPDGVYGFRSDRRSGRLRLRNYRSNEFGRLRRVTPPLD